MTPVDEVLDEWREFEALSSVGTYELEHLSPLWEERARVQQDTSQYRGRDEGSCGPGFSLRGEARR